VYDSASAWTSDSITLSLTIVNIFSGDTIALGVDVFSLETLPPAPGTAVQMQSDLQRISTALGMISSTFQGGPGEEEMFDSAAIFALDSLIGASDTLSLAGALAKLYADDPNGLLLLDALLAASGIDEQTSGYAAFFEEMAASFAARRFTRSVDASTLTDEELAYRMQLYVVVQETGQSRAGR
jgi:hypothetical protein